MDELQKKLHDHTSIALFTFFISSMGVIGVLQASHIIPHFNQVWVLLGAILVWGISLVISDYIYK